MRAGMAVCVESWGRHGSWGHPLPLSLNFGLVEFGQINEKEKFRRYRKYLYEAGAIDKYNGEKKCY